MTLEKINHGTTALVLIDLQNGIARQSVAPHDSREVLSNAAQLARTFRGAGALVVLVRVGYSVGAGEMLRIQVDQPRPTSGPLPADFSEIVEELEQVETDIVVTKHNWSAFYGTDLDVQLRRRGITTIVLGGISTNMGVESTARAAHEHAYNLLLVEDAMASMSASDHLFAVERIFPRIGRVVSTQAVLSVME